MNANTNPSYDELFQQNSLLVADNLELKSQVGFLKFELLDLKRQLFGHKSERFIPEDNAVQGQLELDVEAIAEREITKQEIKSFLRTKEKVVPKKHAGRNDFPPHLKRVRTVIEPETIPPGAKLMGSDVKKTLEHTSASFWVNEIETPKYALPAGEGILKAELPEFALGKSMFGNSFAAHTLVSKFVDHLPEYRQHQILKREDIHIPFSSLNEIPAMVAHCLGALYNVHAGKVLSSKYLQVDETPNRVLTGEIPGKSHRGFYWAYRCPVQNLILFDYRPDRTGKGPRDMLENFKGELQTDGYSVYDEFGKRDGINLFHCWAHARRYFEKALVNDKERAFFMMKKIQLLYETERKAKQGNYSFEQRYELRKIESAPVLDEIKIWLDKHFPTGTLPKSPIGKAINYTRQRWEGLTHYITNGMLEIDNNWVENNIRPLTLGRKNYLFAGSHQGAERAALLYSFFGTCKLKNINPYTWLKDTLDKLPSTRTKDLCTLLP
jgi:transposase